MHKQPHVVSWNQLLTHVLELSKDAKLNSLFLAATIPTKTSDT